MNYVAKKQQNNELISSLMIDGKRYYDAQSIAQNLNNFFVNVGNKQCALIEPTISPLNLLTHRNPNSVVLEETSPYKIFSLIAGLSSKKSSGPDDISASILKSINYPVSYALSWISNKSLSSGIYPDRLKVAKVIPLFKGGDASNPSNFRPISLLSQISKIFEKVLYEKLTSFFDKFKILTQLLYGFRNGYSTTLSLAVYENSLKNIDKGLATCSILVDFSKALTL